LRGIIKYRDVTASLNLVPIYEFVEARKKALAGPRREVRTFSAK
jgi:hypothetical protein